MDEHAGSHPEIVLAVSVRAVVRDLDREVRGADNRRMNVPRFTHRLATEGDVSAIQDVMRASIAENMREFLSGEEISATQESMGLDTTLISDRTYFVVETLQDGKELIVGCGGWSRRRTLYGGDHTAGRDDSYADPATDAARIRAMYTRPGWTRQGIGSLLLQLGERAARVAGYTTIELGATLAGEPLYRARGYVEVGRETLTGANGSPSIVIMMRKLLPAAPSWI
jgi:GNAT superfamily N-acetyltransferase